MLLMHFPPFTWCLCCSGINGLTDEWLRGRRRLCSWVPLASCQYLLSQFCVISFQPFQREDKGLKGLEILGYLVASIHVPLVCCDSSSWCVVCVGRWSLTIPSKRSFAYVQDTLPLQYHSSGWCGLFLCSSAAFVPFWKTNLQNNYRKMKERWNSDGS